ncbi:MAG: hypothetical protein ACFFE5_11060 [Candidatus Thorarchaeota archaeon]
MMDNKNKFKFLYLWIFLIAVSIVPVFGLAYIPEPIPPPPPPPPKTITPWEYWTVDGYEEYGSLNSFQAKYDDDIIHWKGKWYKYKSISGNWWFKIPVFAYEFKADIFFPDPGRIYPTVQIKIRFNYYGTSDLRIYVYYDQGGNECYYERSTGGYIEKTINIDGSKTVWCLVIDSTSPYGFSDLIHQQKLWIDYLAIKYS